ncbi:hypothetical protein GCM10027564_23320 [Luteimonas notoginsengisoli]
MRLAHLEGEALVEGVPEQERVQEPGIHPGHADHTTALRVPAAPVDCYTPGTAHNAILGIKLDESWTLKL